MNEIIGTINTKTKYNVGAKMYWWDSKHDFCVPGIQMPFNFGHFFVWYSDICFVNIVSNLNTCPMNTEHLATRLVPAIQILDESGIQIPIGVV